MRSLRRFAIMFFALAASISLCSNVSATQMAEFTYTETNLGGGQWQYAYTLSNTSEPVLDPGVNIYEITINFETGAAFAVTALPTGWDFISGDTFATNYSMNPDVPPVGNDIGPGMTLSGFVFVFGYQTGGLSYDVTFTNPDDPGNPLLFSGTSTPSAITPVPAPGTMFLLSSGLAGLAWLRKKKKLNPFRLLSKGMLCH